MYGKHRTNYAKRQKFKVLRDVINIVTYVTPNTFFSIS